VVVSLACAGTAHGSVTVGSTAGATDDCGTNVAMVQSTTAAAPTYVAPSAGVVVSWSYLSHASTPSLRFKVYKPTASVQTWFLRSQSAQKAPGSGADNVRPNVLNTFSESPGLRIEAGDHLGLTGANGAHLGCIQTTSNSDEIRVKTGADTTPGQDNPGFVGPLNSLTVDVSAVVEPDADGDGFGDESQDSCPTDATVHAGACPVDLVITKTASASPVVGSNMTYTLTVTNNHATNPADGVNVSDPLPASVTFASSATSQGTCTGTSSVSCALGSIAHGQSATISIVVTPRTAGPLSNTASVTTTSADTDASNNSSTASVRVAPFIPPVPVLSAFKIKPSIFKTSKGARVSYVDSQAATTTFTVSKRVRGVKKGGKCVAPPKKKPKKKPKRCTRLVKRGSFTRQDLGGPVSFRYTGRVKGRALSPGSYRLRAVAVNAGGKSKAAGADFKIKKK
jgi:uncharacterized repeat protein (TIGR01451 family)